jgi:hypothetical protein
MVQLGHFVLHSNVLPPVTAGDYQLLGDQSGTPFPVGEDQTSIVVSSPRFTMPSDQILSTFPPANGEGAYGDRLPQIVLRRRTLPWERNPAEQPAVSTVPWLALVVVAEGEAQLSSPAAVADCVTPGTTLLDPADRDVDQGVYLAVTQTVLDKIFPTADDLPLLTHVREVDVQDTELAGGDDDGWLAVVLANRLPVFDTANGKPVRYLACLVNVEGQLDSLPTPPPPIEFFQYALAQDWTTLALGDVHADQFVTGTGAAAELFGAERRLGAPAQQFQRALPAIGPALDGAAATRTVGAGAAWQTSPTGRIAAAALDADAGRLVRDTMGIGFRVPIEAFAIEPIYRFPVLAHWSFTTTDGATFETLMQDLDVGLIGSLAERDPAAPPAPDPPDVTDTGHIELAEQTRRGEGTRAWYRGPLVPHPTDREQPDGNGRLTVVHSADQLRRVVPDGLEDLSYAAAYEIGRLLALSQLSVVSALLRFRGDQFGAGRVTHMLGALTPPAFSRPLDDLFGLSRIVARGVVETVAANTGSVVGPSRPLADPGRPLELDGDLDSIVAAGLGLDAQAVQQAAASIGAAAALASQTVPLQPAPTGPLLEGPQLEATTTFLHGEVQRLATLAFGKPPAPVVGRRGRARAKPEPPAEPPAEREPDALDELLAPHEEEDKR